MKTKITTHRATHTVLSAIQSQAWKANLFLPQTEPGSYAKLSKIQMITFFLAAGNFPGCLTENPALTDQMGTLLILHR